MVNPLNYEKEILERILREKAEDQTISIDKLHTIVMKEAHILTTITIKKLIQAFELMGYIKLRQDGRFDVNEQTIKERLTELSEKGE